MRSAKLNSYAGQAAFPGGKADTLEESPWDTARREAYEEIGLAMDDDKLKGFKVEHLCELPANLAKTELGVRPCVAYLHPTSSNSMAPGSTASVEGNLIPRLDPKEVAAVFSSPFYSFLRRTYTGEEEMPLDKTGKRDEWYRGNWFEWNESTWRMHDFHVPKPPVTPLYNPSESPLPRSPEPGSQSVLPDDTSETNALDALKTFRVWGMTARILVDAAKVAFGEDSEFPSSAHLGDEEMIGRLIRKGRMGEVLERRKEGEVLREAKM